RRGAEARPRSDPPCRLDHRLHQATAAVGRSGRAEVHRGRDLANVGARDGSSPPARRRPANLAAAYDGATLFGFPLSSLINLADGPGGPAPPSIVPIVENGQPIGVRMTWENLKLTSHESFHTRPPSTTMTLTVERSREKTTTECTLSNFDLVLP